MFTKKYPHGKHSMRHKEGMQMSKDNLFPRINGSFGERRCNVLQNEISAITEM